MRGFAQFTMASLCIGLVGAGLFMSLDSVEHGVVLEAPGTPGRLITDTATATAFFEMNGSEMELTMLFSDQDDPSSVFRTRVVLAEGQSHSILVADADADDGAEGKRFVFIRKDDTVSMSLMPASTRTATYIPGE